MGKILPGRVETGPFSAGRNVSGGAKRRLCLRMKRRFLLMKRGFRWSETEALPADETEIPPDETRFPVERNGGSA
ncbi:hypothetical protein [Bacteroides pyogenes]|uniref:hypothetical protein n=1 Tax=Bacteroides pyogenes TaxID=310300 RepID=UPI0003DDC2DF|nr:hypothetical protein [Bacteroides pyogenes]MBB3894602.1 hypothetical protein [Bacteroides pyogenes]GAE22174.1 hypothetical protein JCM10003_1742 [Bacteroides pyogenes JCM 10003]